MGIPQFGMSCPTSTVLRQRSKRFAQTFDTCVGCLSMPRPDSKFLRLAIYWVARLVLWSGGDRPGRMKRLDREKDIEFDFHERLYFRCRRDWMKQEGWFKPASIPFPD